MSTDIREGWEPREPSPTCEVLMSFGVMCGEPTAFCYPAMGDGYMALCTDHAQKHLRYCVTYGEAREGKTPFVPKEVKSNA